MAHNKFRGKIFVKTSNTAFLTEDENGRPVFEEHIKTFSVVKQQNKFIIYELQRKRKPKRLKTFKALKGVKHDDIIKKVQNNEIHIKQKYVTRLGTKGSKLIQTNYKSKIKGFPQMTALVKVSDEHRKIEDVFIGFSNKYIGFINDQAIKKMSKQCIHMALAKFYSIYGFPRKSDDVTGIIIEHRFQYYKLKEIENMKRNR